MIKSKQAVLIDSRTKKEDIIYMDCPVFNWDEIQGLVSYLVCVFVKNQDETFTEIERIPAVYRMVDFLKIMEGVSFDEYPTKKNEMMIQQISDNSSKYWDLTSDKLEIA